MKANTRASRRRVHVVPLLVLMVAALVVPTLVASSSADAATSASDNFARANGSLGPNWTALSDGALAISNDMVIGTNAGGNSGDIRTAETYTSDQYSSVQVTSVPLTGSQWIGPMVTYPGHGQRSLRRHLLLELREPRADVVQAGQQRLDPAWLHLRERGLGRRDPAQPHSHRYHPDLR